MESEARYYFRCDHWPWSRSFCVVGPILSVVFQGKSMTHSKAHYPLRLGAAGVFLSKCSAYWRIEIHVSRFRYDNPHYLASSSHLFLPRNSSLSSFSSPALPPHFSLPPHHLPSAFYPMCHRSFPIPTASATLISRYSSSHLSPLFLHLSFRAQRETSGTGSSRILISQFVVHESCQTAFSIHL